MAKIPLSITTGFYVSESLPISGQRCVNWYVNFPQADTVTDGNLFATPGLNQLATVSSIDSTRGAHEMAGLPYFVIGTSLIRLNRTFDVFGAEVFSTTNLGTIEGTGPVSMDDNGTQLVIVAPGGKSYTFIEPATLAEITDANFDGPASSVVFIDGFFVFTTADGKKFFNSPLNDARGTPGGTTYDALDFSTAEADPDQIRAALNFRNQLYILGSITTEVFSNIGRTPAPFARIPGSVLPKGISAPNAIVKTQNTFAFIGAGDNESPSVWSFTGNNYQKLSTTAIDNVLSRLTDAELALVTSWSYAEAGAFFIGFSLPSTCFVYDLISQRWHERISTVSDEDVAYRVEDMITAYGRVLVGDSVDGRIGEIDRDIFTEYSGDIKCEMITKPFDNQGDPVFLASLEAVLENGVGNLAVPDPIIRLSISDDGGRTFNSELQRKFGRVGEYNHRTLWNRLGRFPRSRVLKFETSSAVKRTFIKLEADIA